MQRRRAGAASERTLIHQIPVLAGCLQLGELASGREYLSRHLQESPVCLRIVRNLLATIMKKGRAYLERLGYRLHDHPALAVLDRDGFH